MEHLLLTPVAMLIACTFFLGTCLVLAELSLAVGARLAAGRRRLRARWLPPHHSSK